MSKSSAEIIVCERPGELPAAAIQSWREQGFAVVRGYLEPEIVDATRATLESAFPEGMAPPHDFGSGGRFEFPTTKDSLNDLSVSEHMILAAQQLLRTDEVVLVQSDAWPKVGTPVRGGASNNSQRVHMDYGNNTFLHPPEWEHPNVLSAIVYFNDLSVTGGGTAVVPREGPDDPLYAEPYINMPGQAGIPFINDRDDAEAYLAEHRPDMAAFRARLYAKEVRITSGLPGDVLLYRHDVWHRGTPVTAPHVRRVVNLAWRRHDAPWIATWNQGFPRTNYYGHVEAFIARITPAQRATLGFPAVGHSYWTPRSVANVAARYPGLDPAPYLSAYAAAKEAGAREASQAGEDGDKQRQ